MAESIRSLTVKLGYDVDTTGADIFKARFKSLTSSLESISKNLQRQLAPKKLVKIGPLEKRINLLGKRFRRAMRKALRMKPSQFSDLEKDLAFISKKVKAGFEKAKFAAIAGAAALAAAATKVFTGFADVEQARLTLEFKTDNFKDINEKLKAIRKETGSVVSELDALNAVNIGADLTGDVAFIVDNFATVIKLSKILNKDVNEVQTAFSTFVATGSNLEELVKFRFFDAEQIEALKKASTDFTAQGLQTRKTLLTSKISEQAPRIQEKFNSFLTLSNATLDKLSTNIEDTTTIIGQKLNPVLNDFFDRLSQITTKIKNSVTEENIIPIQRAGSRAGAGGGPLSGGQDNSTNTNTFIINEAVGPRATAAEVEKILSKKIIENSTRKEIPQSLNTTIQPAVSQ